MKHRDYVGGHWDEIGSLGFEFLVDNGLTPDDVVVDLGCGALRIGRHLISYLDDGNYLGIDHNEWLIKAAIDSELPQGPGKSEFVVSGDFEVDKFTKTATVGIAQSLFTHMTADEIDACLSRVFGWSPDMVLYATWHICETPREHPERGHDEWGFHYTVEEIKAMADRAGRNITWVGEWGHPRGQHMSVLW